MDVEPLMIMPPGGRAVARVGPERQILFLVNYIDASANVMLSCGYVDALTNEPVVRELGLARRAR